jgi:hypothetical protein
MPSEKIRSPNRHGYAHVEVVGDAVVWASSESFGEGALVRKHRIKDDPV